MEFLATTASGEALTGDNIYTTHLNSGHSLIESISVNLGQCLLSKLDTNYGLLSRVLLQDYSQESRKTFLKDLEGKSAKH